MLAQEAQHPYVLSMQGAAQLAEGGRGWDST